MLFRRSPSARRRAARDSSAHSRQLRRFRPGRGLRFESLESRQVLATLAIGDAPAVAEGNVGTADAVFNIVLTPEGGDVNGTVVTVAFSTADISAMAASDYAAQAGTLGFTLDGTTQTQMVTVAVNGDALDEPDETFQVNLSGAVNATVTDMAATGTINDDDPTPTLSIDDVALAEGDAGTSNLVFTVSLSAASGQEVTAQFATADMTAMAPADYVAQSGTLTLAPGTTTQTITIAVNGDLLDEANETFQVNLTAPANATLADAQGIGTITDDDPTPTLSIDDVAIAEGNAGASNLVFTVSLSAASGQPVTVSFTTANVTAAAPGDYAAQSGTLSFAPGTTTQTITIAVNGDLLDEANETFQVNLSGPVNATLADAQGIGTITDDDPPMVTINDVAQAEGDDGTTNMVFTVSLSSASGTPVTVQFTTANATAVSPGDFAAQTGVLTFAPGETTRTITVAVRGETTQEIDENFFVNLSAASGANLGDSQGAGLIFNDDAPQFIVTGASLGGGPRVRVFNPNNGAAVHDFYAYDPSFLGGVNVATADFNMDGVADIVTGAGPGGGPHVRVFDGATGQQLPGPIGSFFAYASSFSGGVYVAAADMNGDNIADVITGAGQGGGPHVRVFNGASGAILSEFFAYAPEFLGGVRLAVAQVVSGGNPEIVTGAGVGGGPHIRVFSASGAPIAGPSGSFFAYDPSFTGGIYVAAADVNDDGQVDIITGAGQGGGPHVRTFNGATGVQLAEPAGSFFAFDPSFTGGVRVAAGNITGDGGAEIITGAGPGAPPRLRAFRGADLAVVSDFPPYESTFTGGIVVAGTTAGLLPGAPLLAADDALPGNSTRPLTQADLSTDLIAAVERRLGVSLSGVQIAIADLPGRFLGSSEGNFVVLDRDAAGLGWFVDASPSADEEFGVSAGMALPARRGGPAENRIDLLTVLAHEVAHWFGYQHVDAADQLLSATLPAGQRRISRLDALDAVLASGW
jgi:hypothetical protein